MSATNRCAGNTKSGTQCTRNCTGSSRYCWQHQNIYDEKEQEIKEASENRFLTLPLNQLTTRTSTANTYENKVFEPNVLKLINQFNPIPEGTSKLLTVPAKQKWELIEANLHSVAPEMKFPVPQERYLNRLYNYLIIKGQTILALPSVEWLLRHDVYYDEIYQAFASKTSLENLSAFMVYAYEQKAFRFFYLLYPIWKEKLAKTGYFSKAHIFSYDEKTAELNQNINSIFNLVNLDILTDQEVYLQKDTNKYTYFFDKGYYMTPFDLDLHSYAIFIRVRKLNKKMKTRVFENSFNYTYRTPNVKNITDLAIVFEGLKEFDLYSLFAKFFNDLRLTWIQAEFKMPPNLKPDFIYRSLDILFDIYMPPLIKELETDPVTYKSKEIMIKPETPAFIQSKDTYFNERRFYLNQVSRTYPNLDLKRYQDLNRKDLLNQM